MTDIVNQQNTVNGRWTKDQHQKFLLGLQMFGKNWKKIQTLIGTRNGSQIRSHAQKFFLKVKKSMDPQLSQEKQSPEEPSVISNSTCQNEKISQSSYFFERIIKHANDLQKFDFWSTFVDYPGNNSSLTESRENKRKSSFVLWESLEEDEESLSINRQPYKKIKI